MLAFDSVQYEFQFVSVILIAFPKKETKGNERKRIFIVGDVERGVAINDTSGGANDTMQVNW